MYVQILKLLKHGDATCDEVELALRMRHQTASARFTEMHKSGFVEYNGKTRPTRSGRSAHVYVLTSAGEAWVTLNANK
jgi:predicted ArsR family transcriptional regulator